MQRSESDLQAALKCAELCTKKFPKFNLGDELNRLVRAKYETELISLFSTYTLNDYIELLKIYEQQERGEAPNKKVVEKKAGATPVKSSADSGTEAVPKVRSKGKARKSRKASSK